MRCVENAGAQTDTGTVAVRRYLERPNAGAVLDGDVENVEFLARGEYSLNYRVRRSGRDLVARLITGTQIGLPLGEQALFEHRALHLLAPSGVTPKPYHVDPEPEDLPYPLILEEYLTGRPLSYATDLAAAARCVAKIHDLGVPEAHRLQRHPDPAPSILAESRELVAPYLDWEDAPEESKEALHGAFGRIEQFLEQSDLFSEEDLSIVNYDLNTHNFIVQGAEAKLVDWEKARIAPRTQDVAHFLLPTTTLWRDASAARLTPDQETEFVDTYLSQSSLEDADRFRTQLEAVKIIVSLRAVSWCAWALQETARSGRAITNEETLKKSRLYLEPGFLRELFAI